MDNSMIESGVQLILKGIGEDVHREGLTDTPKRVARMYNEVCSGYEQDPKELFKAVFNEDHKELVIVKDIYFYSHCEHHMVPFSGKAHIGYIPNGKIVGLSKLARLVEIYSKRLQVQERLTSQVADDIMKYLEPAGCMVVMEASHLCMCMRGVKKPGSSTTTSAVRGIFADNAIARSEFLSLIDRE